MKKHLALLLSTFNLILFFSMKSFWSGIEGMLGSHVLQYIVLGLLVGLVLVSILNEVIIKSNTLLWILLATSILLTIALFYMLYMGRDAILYVIRTFIEGIIVVGIIYLLYFFIYLYPKCNQEKLKTYKHLLFIFSVLGIIISTLGLTINFITYQPVVYAVENTYQIVWSTSSPSTAEVTIGDETYYDLYAGSENTQTLIHKVVIPMLVLDHAGSYTISSTGVIYRGPYSGILGRTISKTYDFYPVDETGGVNYYTLADTHGFTKAAIEAASYFGDDLDFLILDGDIISHMETADDINIINKLAFEVTGGSHPVIYSRGNHEVKGEMANELYKYVGSLNEKFYYTVWLYNFYIIVLDLGEDHGDDWWEYYGTAEFDSYRDEQTEFLQDIVDSGIPSSLSSISFCLGISHIPVTFVSTDEEYSASYKETWTNLLNQIHLDMMVSGHWHDLVPILSDLPANQNLTYDSSYSSDTSIIGYHTDATFPLFIVSRRSNTQDVTVSENYFGQAFSGLATTVDVLNRTIVLRYTNALGEVVEIVNPFTGVVQSEFNLSY